MLYSFRKPTRPCLKSLFLPPRLRKCLADSLILPRRWEERRTFSIASAVFTGTVDFSTTILLVVDTEAIMRAAPSQYVRSAALPAPTPRVFVGVFTLRAHSQVHDYRESCTERILGVQSHIIHKVPPNGYELTAFSLHAATVAHTRTSRGRPTHGV